MIDLHCHILPGLDDGAKTLDEAIEMARIAAVEGIKTIIATPHLFRGGQINDVATVEEKQRELIDALANRHIPIEIKRGAEVHFSHNLVKEIRSDRSRLVLNGSSYMFVEFPSSHIYQGAKNAFFDLMSEGIVPIIAHPERNAIFARNPGLLFELVQQGALVQVNAGSLTLVYGHQPAEVVLRFLEWDLVHFIGSDGHNTHSIPPRLAEAAKKVEILVGQKAARALVSDNPKAVLEDREIPYFPEPRDPRKSKKSFHFRVPGFFKKNR
jgi:protein-tyrosine phosphatase